MTFLVFRALKRPKLIFWELSKTVFGFFVAQIGPELAGGALSAPLRQEVLENFRVKNRVKDIGVNLKSYSTYLVQMKKIFYNLFFYWNQI